MTIRAESEQKEPNRPTASGIVKSHLWTDFLALIGPATALTALLYYFGYVSSDAFYSYFGINQSVLELSTNQYLLRSTGSIFRPLATIPIIAAGAFLIHHLLQRYVIQRRPSLRRGVTIGLFVLGGVLAGLSVIGLYRVTFGLWAPLAMGAAGICLEYGAWNASQPHGLSPGSSAIIVSGTQLRRGVVAAQVLIAAFWAVTEVANVRGLDAALLFQRSLPIQSQAVVYSAQDLHLSGPGVAVTAIVESDSAYHFRYNGLRVLLHATGRWYLVPVEWSRSNGAIGLCFA